MAVSQLDRVIRHVRRVVPHSGGAGPTDAELLGRFVEQRDGAAVATLVRRHGPMVWGVCRRLLPSHHDAEDAFQATFLVLFRRAASVRPRERLAAWLYGVARQTARKARATAAARRRREVTMAGLPEPAVEPDPGDDVRPLLDLELGRLPAKYRAVLVLCELEGVTRKEAARQLGLPEGTVASRLATARQLLAHRLGRHGLAPAGVALAGLAPGTASACVPGLIVASALELAAAIAAGRPGAGIVSAVAADLARGGLRGMVLTNLKIATAVAVLTAVGVTAALCGAGDRPAPPTARPPQAPTATRPAGEGWQAFRTLVGHDDAVQALAFGPEPVLVSGGKDGHVKVWDVGRGAEVGSLGDPRLTNITAITYAPDAGWVAFRSADAIALAYGPAMQDGKPLHLGRTSAPLNFFSPGGVRVALAMTSDAKAYLLQFDPVKELNVWWGLDLRAETSAVRSQPALKGHTAQVRCAAFSPDDRLVATGSADQTVRLWVAATGKEQLTLRGHRGGVEAVAFAPDGRTLATVGRAGDVKLWDVATGKERATLAAGRVRCVAFAPDGRTLATGGEDKVVRVCDVAGGRVRSVLAGHTAAVTAVTFRRDGRLLASAGGVDKTVRLWRRE